MPITWPPWQVWETSIRDSYPQYPVARGPQIPVLPHCTKLPCFITCIHLETSCNTGRPTRRPKCILHRVDELPNSNSYLSRCIRVQPVNQSGGPLLYSCLGWILTKTFAFFSRSSLQPHSPWRGGQLPYTHHSCLEDIVHWGQDVVFARRIWQRGPCSLPAK